MTTERQHIQRTVLFSFALIALFAMSLVLSCKSDSNSNPYGNNGGGNPGANEVWIQGMAFNPGTRTVSVGTTVTWTNKDGVAHTVTGSGWGSGNLAQNAPFAHTFDTAGSYPYHCSIHTSMTGTITVQ
jgi:plastocyanin